ncbi:hypothetical protein AAG570_008591 [Ranatra chinensis]|uniref:Uncharacterized protein n=1 Tax=Ranatra chinensis TaxID=642074 RepID=A0ABD0YRB8_9HEMI
MASMSRNMLEKSSNQVTTKRGSLERIFHSGSVVPFVVPVALVVIIMLVIALAVYVVRHRQLQNSFTLFANSYYSTRSGAARFTSSDGLDDEDSPVIRGFSDDEPLVIA